MHARMRNQMVAHYMRSTPITHDEFAGALLALRPIKVALEGRRKHVSYANRRPESPKGQVYEIFKAKGADAARKLAEKLEVEPGRVNRWLQSNGAGFQKTATAKATEGERLKKVAPKKVAAPKKAAKKPAAKKVVKKAPAAEAATQLDQQ